MTVTKPLIPLVSSAALFLALTQSVLAPSALAAEPTPATKPAPPAQYPAGAPAPPTASSPTTATPSTPTTSPAESPRAKADQRRAEMQEQHQKRYEEFRARAADKGIEMPAMPEPPDMTSWHEMCEKDEAAMRQWREDMQARMRTMTPEERMVLREERWKQMRAEAAERGFEMPETPPWQEAEKRRQEMDKRFEEYRKTVEQMTDEQREAARALFGRPQPMTPPPMPGRDLGQGQEPWGYPGEGAYQGAPRGMPHPPMMPYQNAPGYDQGPPPPSATGN